MPSATPSASAIRVRAHLSADKPHRRGAGRRRRRRVRAERPRASGAPRPRRGHRRQVRARQRARPRHPDRWPRSRASDSVATGLVADGRRLFPLARNSSAAFTRRLTSSGLSSSSLVKIALMCFSTARLVSTSDSAIAALLLPWASSASTSCSRRVSADSGDFAPTLRASHEHLDHLRIDHGSAGDHRFDRGDELLRIAHPLLEEVSPPRRCRNRGSAST